MKEIKGLFESLKNEKLTENGDKAFISTNNKMLDVFFGAPYLERNLSEVKVGDTDIEKLFSMFMRDPRYGLGRRDLGRELMKQTGLTPAEIVLAGRYDDLYAIMGLEGDLITFKAAKEGNHLAKKWLPRYTSGKKAKSRAVEIINNEKITVQEYQKIIKTDTVENLLNEHSEKDLFGKPVYSRRGEINFETVPSLARIKWSQKFQEIDGYEDFIKDVISGDKKMTFKTGNAYDVYRAMKNDLSDVETELLWKELDKVELSCLPIIDTSGSMNDSVDSIGKALSIGTLLAEGSTYLKNHFITFSDNPELVEIKGDTLRNKFKNMSRANWDMTTNLSAVFDLIKKADKFPDYLIVLSDMEFNSGSRSSKDRLMKSLRDRGIDTKIVWWNFNTRNITVPDSDEWGNLFMSGYSPELLSILNLGFDAGEFLLEMLKDYHKKIQPLMNP